MNRSAPRHQLLLAVILAFALAPAWADLTLMGRSSVAAMGMPSIGQEKLMLKNHYLRRDVVDRGRAYSYLFDLKAREVTVLDHAFKTAQVHGLAKVDNPTVKAKQDDVKLELSKTGKQHSIRHWKCDEHSLQSDMATQLGTDAAVFRMVGSVWLAANTPEQREMSSLREAAGNADYLLGLPSMAQVSPDQARAIGETIRQLSRKGILCGLDVQTRYEGSGRMVELARKVATRLTVAYLDFSTEKIADSVFLVPDGYRVIKP
jgi:hypothetical protein